MDAQWLDQIDVRLVDDSGPRPIVETLRPVTFYSANLQREIVVPAGFVYDGSSIPQAAMSVTGYPAMAAALLHDWCCRSRCVDRSVGDRLFLEALRAGYNNKRVDEGVALAMYAAVAAYTHITTYQPDPPPYNPGGMSG
jgi:hypothetical protein